MINFYKRLAIPDLTSQPDVIRRAINNTKTDPMLRNTAERILGNPSRKKEYDQYVKVMNQIGQLRANLGKNHTTGWLSLNCTDFDKQPSTDGSILESIKTKNRAPQSAQMKKRSKGNFTASLFIGIFFAILGFLTILAAGDIEKLILISIPKPVLPLPSNVSAIDNALPQNTSSSFSDEKLPNLREKRDNPKETHSNLLSPPKLSLPQYPPFESTGSSSLDKELSDFLDTLNKPSKTFPSLPLPQRYRQPTTRSLERQERLAQTKKRPDFKEGRDKPKEILVSLPLPPNGVVRKSFDEKAIAPLRFEVSSNTHYYIKLEMPPNSSTAMTVFIRAGGKVKLKVPLGEYKLKYAVGNTWYGPKKSFGPKGSYFKADRILSFIKEETTNGFRVKGYTVILKLRRRGNLSRSRISWKEF